MRAGAERNPPRPHARGPGCGDARGSDVWMSCTREGAGSLADEMRAIARGRGFLSRRAETLPGSGRLRLEPDRRSRMPPTCLASGEMCLPATRERTSKSRNLSQTVGIQQIDDCGQRAAINENGPREADHFFLELISPLLRRPATDAPWTAHSQFPLNF